MQIFIRLVKYIKYRWKPFVVGTLISILSTGLSIYAPTIGSRLIDIISDNYRNNVKTPNTVLIQNLSWYFLIVCIGIIASYISFVILARSSNDITKIIRNEAHEHMQKLPISYFDNKPAGKISARIVNDTESLKQNFYMNFMNQILINLITVVGIYIAIYLVSPTVGIWLLALIPIFIIWQIIYMKLVQPVNLKYRETISQLNSQIAEMISGIPVIQVFHRQKTMADAFEKTNEEWLKSQNKLIRIDMFLSWNFSQLLDKLVRLLIMLYIGTQYISGIFNMSVGTLYLLLEYASRLFDPITMIVRLLTFVQQAIASGTRIFELMDSPIEEDSDQAIEITKGNVTFKDVSFAYKEEQYVLKHLDFEAKEGQTIGIVGHTGSGKSSIINLLFRFYDPQKGYIEIDDQNIQEYQRESIRNKMGIVLQEPYLFSGTIASNVSMNDPNISDEEVLEALIKVGAQPMLDKLEKGIYEPVIEKGQSLSSGERQLISFARALASQPKILILDEATSHIDTETEAIIQHAMNVVQEGRTTFIVAHRLSTIQNADQILVLEKGEIIERGNHSTLMAMNGLYSEMYQMQGAIGA